jgi:hypothetical protein
MVADEYEDRGDRTQENGPTKPGPTVARRAGSPSLKKG